MKKKKNDPSSTNVTDIHIFRVYDDSRRVRERKKKKESHTHVHKKIRDGLDFYNKSVYRQKKKIRPKKRQKKKEFNSHTHTHRKYSFV